MSILKPIADPLFPYASKRSAPGSRRPARRTVGCPPRAGALSGTAPRTAAAWTGNGPGHQERGLKQRPERAVPIPPDLVSLLRRHLAIRGTAPDGRLFPGRRGGILSESVYGRPHPRRALDPDDLGAGVARRPYDLRHAALSAWLDAGAPPAQIARPAPGTAPASCSPPTPTPPTAATKPSTTRSRQPSTLVSRHRAPRGDTGTARSAQHSPRRSRPARNAKPAAPAWPRPAL